MAVKSICLTFIVVFTAFFVGAHAARAQEAVFPLACKPGANCFILSYPDLDPAEGSAKDYACGPSANDGDGMLRIGVRSVEDLRQGVDVLATRAGKVIDVQDGLEDLVVASKQDLKRGTSVCGNGVVIDHGSGLQSGYCNLREGSIPVQVGQMVAAGDKIGQVGQSGVAFWPQLGFSMQSSGLLVDPISSMSDLEGCGWKQRPMIPLPDLFREYQPVAIIGMGFTPQPVTDNAMVLGRAPVLSVLDRLEPSMNLWGMILGVHIGDKIEVRLRGPNGRTFEYREIIANTENARTPINVSRDRGYSGWRQGIYTGEITVTRTVQHKPVIATRSVQVLVR